MIKITPTLSFDESEISWSFVRSRGPGGQNVNKLATAVLLRFNVKSSSSLPDEVKERLLILLGKKITHGGEYIIKAESYRTQERNRQDALYRLVALLKRVAIPPKKRHPTKPSKAAMQRRQAKKKLHSLKKLSRRAHRGLD